jgi:asparagine synthase (glutamine-hydrolysing)
MCGLCGIVLDDPRERVDPERLARMTDALAHRGPDDRAFFSAGPASLGFRRLSIIDPTGGAQPLVNETGDVVLVLNGELYNFRDVRPGLEARAHRFRSGSDAEVLLHLYEERGASAVEELAGMYAFALLDLRDGRTRLVLGRDPLGIKPLYWARTAEGLAFASEPKALLEAGSVARELRAEALLDYLVQGYVGGPRAAWHGMNRLPPGHVLEFEPGGEPRITRHFDLPTGALREPARPGEVLEALDRSVAEHLVSDVPLGAFLSGGIDSSAVAASMHAALPRPPVLCSIGFEEASHDELGLAVETARSLGAEHHTRVLRADPKLALETLSWFFDEPLADPSVLPTWLVSRVAREHVTVALSGDGGDEVFAGYRRYVHDVAENRVRGLLRRPGQRAARALGAVYPHLARAPRFLRARRFLTNVGDSPARAYWRSVTPCERGDALALLAPELARRLADHDPFHAFAEHYERAGVDDPLYRAQYADFHTYLPDQILAKVDRASMAVSLEVRVPFLDHRFAARFANLPAADKVRARRGKHALREALRGRLRPEILDGEKRGFDMPVAAWIRGPLRPAIADAIEELPAEWFRKEPLREMLAVHTAGRRDHGRLLWSLAVLERWRRTHAVRGIAG